MDNLAEYDQAVHHVNAQPVWRVGALSSVTRDVSKVPTIPQMTGLSGGGLSSLHILKEVMASVNEKANNKPPVKPCDRDLNMRTMCQTRANLPCFSLCCSSNIYPRAQAFRHALHTRPKIGDT